MKKLNLIQIFRRYFQLVASNHSLDGQYLLHQARTVHALQHALASPVNQILLDTELGDDIPTPKKIKTKLRRIQRAAEMLKGILDTMIKNDESKILFLPQLSAEKVVRVFNKKDHGFEVILQSSIENMHMYGSVILFEELLYCLLDNALEAYRASTLQRLVLVKLSHNKDQIKLKVADFGTGMNFFERKIAFVKGVTFKQSGSGLGLFLARSLVERFFGGRMSLLSYPDLGTAVVCYFPVVSTESK